MSANTSTPITLAAEIRPWEGTGWRAVSAQYECATLALVHGNLTEHDLLETILEETRLRPPAEAAGLHDLLATPYRCFQLPSGSRFCTAYESAVFYGAEDVKTACAEAGYARLRFWRDSVGLSRQPAFLPLTLFEFHAKTDAAIDLTSAPFSERRTQWNSANDYRATQAIATQARRKSIQLIRYESAFNGPDGRCLAALSPQVFKSTREPFRHQLQSWSLFIQPPDLTVWQRALLADRFRFSYPESPA